MPEVKSSGPMIISVVVTLGFFLTLFAFLFRPITLTEAGWTALNILLGVLASEFGGVVKYNIGSTRTSQAKDDTIKSLAEKA